MKELHLVQILGRVRVYERMIESVIDRYPAVGVETQTLAQEIEACVTYRMVRWDLYDAIINVVY